MSWLVFAVALFAVPWWFERGMSRRARRKQWQDATVVHPWL